MYGCTKLNLNFVILLTFSFCSDKINIYFMTKFCLICERKGCVHMYQKSKWTALLLCIFFGGLGLHRFYTGKVRTGILWLLTGGCFGIGYVVDLIMISTDKFTDKAGTALRKH